MNPEINEVRSLCLYLVDETETILPRIQRMISAMSDTPYICKMEILDEVKKIEGTLLALQFASEQVIEEADAIEGID